MHYTPKQLKAMQFIRDFRLEHLVSPTLEELSEHLQVTKPTAFGHIEALIRKGALRKTRSEARSLEILDPLFLASAPVMGHARGDGGMGGRDSSAFGPGGFGQREGWGQDGWAGATYRTRIPIIGKIAAGQAIEAIVESEPADLADRFPLRENCFALEVTGDSMIEDGIFDGDIVVVENRRTATNGEVVVAIVEDNEATLKRFYRDCGRIRLQPANSSMPPIYVEQCEIRGVVVSVHRRY